MTGENVWSGAYRDNTVHLNSTRKMFGKI